MEPFLQKTPKNKNRLLQIAEKYESYKADADDMLIESESGNLIFTGTHGLCNQLTHVDRTVLEDLDSTFEELKPKRSKKRKRKLPIQKNISKVYEEACLNISMEGKEIFEESNDEMDESVPSCSSLSGGIKKRKLSNPKKPHSHKMLLRRNKRDETDDVDSLIDSILDESFVADDN